VLVMETSTEASSSANRDAQQQPDTQDQVGARCLLGGIA
jgi:hypothetical protein